MLVLTRRVGEEIFIGGEIRVPVAAVNGQRVRLGVTAPHCVRVVRQELLAEDSRSQKPLSAVADRGETQLGSTAPTYYAASITRGLQLQLVGVVRGVSTILGQVSSPDYVSGKWACVTLYVSGTNLRAQVEHLDRFQYLNAAGQWPTDPAWALNLTDASIAGSGLVGIGRPSSYTGVLTFDDFGTGPTSTDSVAPSVTITSPADATAISGLVNVQANATDNIGVTKVEFLVDNVVR
jgi:carbon storage regulator CsrA